MRYLKFKIPMASKIKAYQTFMEVNKNNIQLDKIEDF